MPCDATGFGNSSVRYCAVRWRMLLSSLIWWLWKRSSLRRNEIPPELNRKFTQPGRLDWHAGLPPVTFAQIVIRPGRVPDLPSARAALQEVGPKERVMRDN